MERLHLVLIDRDPSRNQRDASEVRVADALDWTNSPLLLAEEASTSAGLPKAIYSFRRAADRRKPTTPMDLTEWQSHSSRPDDKPANCSVA